MSSHAVAERRLHVVPDLLPTTGRPVVRVVVPVVAGLVLLAFLLRRKRNR